MKTQHFCTKIYIGSVMDIVLASSAVDRAFEPRLGQTKDERSDMSIRGELFQ